MAALTTTKVTRRLPLGDRVIEVLQATIANTAAADEWLPTGLSKIEGVLGSSVLGTASAALNFVLDAQGTGVTAGTNPGDLGIESGTAGVVQVTVIGRP